MKDLLLPLLVLLIATPLSANNIQVTNVSLENRDATNDNIEVEFDISWENSWRTSTLESNWDAAWIFVKYRLKTGFGGWKHATLSTTQGDHANPSGTTIDPSSDGKGVFLYRSSNGIGNVSYTDVALQWEYGTDGLVDNDSVIVRVHAIEMVYIPQGSFYVGDNSVTNIHAHFEAGNSEQPFQITSEGSITLGGTSTSNLSNHDNNGSYSSYYDDDFDHSTTQTLPAAFPKGYDAFYIMKYEGSQEQYADFLNTLTITQVNNRYYSTSSYRYTISGSHPNRSASAPERACNYLRWADNIAYLDWAGLRPLTELEYEKAVRGGTTPYADGYAWLNDQICGTSYTITNDGATNSSVSNQCTSSGNANYSSIGPNGPMRCGVFATSSTAASRQESGGSYLGVMELSGNVWEFTVTVGQPNGRSFTGDHGDGALDFNGNADVSSWELTDSFGIRGGSWENSTSLSRVSDRYYSGYDATSRDNSYGFRGVRTAP